MADFAYYYDLPSDCLKVRRLSAEAVDIPYRIEGRRLTCDESSITLLYTYRVTNVQYFDASFVQCLIAMLAWKISYPIRKELALEGKKREEFNLALSDATGVDAQEGTPDVPQCDDLIRVR